jgi:hypothetical protein
VVGAWRLDLPIDIEDTTDNESDGKTCKGDSEVEIGNNDSNSEYRFFFPWIPTFSM